MTLCSRVIAVKSSPGWRDIVSLPCRSWNCPECGPKRRQQLIAVAFSGTPNKFLTLTTSPNTAPTAAARRTLLGQAWHRLHQDIRRQFAKAPSERWRLPTPRANATLRDRIRIATTKTPQTPNIKIPYLAVCERNKRGDPHLHILLRAPFIPQDWLSWRMRVHANAPIVDIRAVADPKRITSYVAKYIGKDPHKFQGSKRYFMSRDYAVSDPKIKDDLSNRLADHEIIARSPTRYLAELDPTDWQYKRVAEDHWVAWDLGYWYQHAATILEQPP